MRTKRLNGGYSTIRLMPIAIILFVAAHRLPAPIQEVQETPAPTATIAATPSPEQHPTQTPAPSPLSRDQAARVAGTWVGKINYRKMGEIEYTLIVNVAATSLIQKSQRFGEFAHPTTLTGGTLSWNAGTKADVPWTLTPNAGGQTAIVTVKIVNGEETTATFRHAATSPTREHGRKRSKPY